MTIQPRTMRVADVETVDLLLMESYGNKTSFRPRLERHLRLEPEGWLVAEEAGRVVGTGGLTVMGRTGWIGLVGVDPAAQRRGIASLLTRRLLELADERGCARVLLDASPSGKPVYDKLGFVAEDEVAVWQRAGGAARLEGAGSIAIEAGASAREELLALDRQVFGDDRARVVASFIADDPAAVLVARGPAGDLRGYAIAQGSGMIGPWVALDTVAARALLVEVLERRGALALSVCLPAVNDAGASLLEEAGFARARSLTHMRRGDALEVARRRRIFGQANLAFG
jgi:predicted N-acetyltransferase YhbS